jgi:hypothetical protein
MKSGNFSGSRTKKHRGIVADKVPIAVFGVEFQRKAAHVAFGVGRAALAGDRRKARERFGLLADLRKQLRSRKA